MPVGIGHDLGLVELGAVGAVQGRELVDPVAVAQVEQATAERLGAGGVGVRGREQDQLGERGVGEAFPDPLLLSGDHCGGGLADRQPALAPVPLVVVVDQHGRVVAVVAQAVQGQAQDLGGSPSGVHEQLDRDPDLAAGGSAFEDW
jgi:hypothetical protein